MRIMEVVRSGLRHTRIVPSGSPPLYRLNLVGILVSAIISALIGEAPTSVADTSPRWFVWAFIGLQFLATVLVLGSLYSEDGSSRHAAKLRHSLAFEFTGLVFLQTVIIVNVVAVMFWQQGPPAAPGTWLSITFSLWIWTRLRDIRSAIRELS